MFLLVLCAVVAYANAANRLCHGNIDNLHPSGQANGGVGASNNDAQYDMNDLQNHRNCYEASADNNCIQSALLGGIASRESRGGRLLVATGGYGDNGNAWGIMQCDLRYSGLNCKACPWDSCCHIEMLTSQTLVPFINQIRAKFPGWNQDQALQGGVAAYNQGVSSVHSWEAVDGSTTGRDYSNDVIARAKYLHSHGWN
ncbi:hypothetical protein BsWGS_26089 [Bradybaena similaris]